MTLASVRLLDVWSALGGGPLRGKRGQAFWRDGDSFSVAIKAEEGTWYDHRDGRGGGALALVETALGYTRSSAIQWLEKNCGLDARRSLSPLERNQYAQRITESVDAESWSIAAAALAEDVLNGLEADDPTRADFTRLLHTIGTGRGSLIGEYHAWRDAYPELTAGMVRAGRDSEARMQRRLALYLMQEVSNAA